MSLSLLQRCRPFVLLAVCLSALAITLSEFVQLRALDTNQANEALARLSSQQPWGGYAARQAAAQLNAQWRLNPLQAQENLAWAMGRYPLDPWRWLTLARIEQAQGLASKQIEGRLLAAHATQPQHPDLHREILNLSQRLGDPQMVLASLYRWLMVSPGSVNEALFTADRWVDDLPAALPQILPPDEGYWIQALTFARTNRLPELAEAVWAALPKPRVLGDQALDDYLVHLSNMGEFERLHALWAEYDVSYPDTGIPGGHFHVAKGALSQFGWDVRAPAGVRIRRQTQDLPPDFRSATWRQAQGWARFLPGALTIEFDGEHNVNLSTPKIRMPAPAPGRYRLTGWWQASGMTTRSLPLLEVVNLQERSRVRLDLPNRNFPWVPFEMVFEITEPDETLIIQLIRRRTQAFDRNIEGSLSLTGLRLESVPDTPAVVAPPNTAISGW